MHACMTTCAESPWTMLHSLHLCLPHTLTPGVSSVSVDCTIAPPTPQPKLLQLHLVDYGAPTAIATVCLTRVFCEHA